MIQLPTEYGNLPADYASWIPQDYGHPTAGHEGKSDMHNFFEARDFCVVKFFFFKYIKLIFLKQGRPSSCNLNERSMKTVSMLESRNFQSPSAKWVLYFFEKQSSLKFIK